MKKKYFYIFMYISFLFLAYALYKKDYFKIPKIENSVNLLISVVFLFASFLFLAKNWQQILLKHKIPIKFSQSISSTGLSIFGKYIPGKIWTLIGRAAYVYDNTHHTLNRITSISIEAQIFHIWLGMIFGMVGIFLLKKIYIWEWLILFCWFFLGLIIFSNFFQVNIEKILSRVLKKRILIPRLNLKTKIELLPWFVLPWIFCSIAFYFFISALLVRRIPFYLGFGFPFAITLGILAVFSPGGLGVREGIMIGFLVLAGLDASEAITISIASRIWFLIGEILIFILGLASSLRDKTKKMTVNSAR